MARILIAHEKDPTFTIEVYEIDPTEGAYSATCCRCGWSASDHGARQIWLDEAVNSTMIHLDHKHPEG